MVERAIDRMRLPEIRIPLQIFIYSRVLYYATAFVLTKALHIKFSLQIFHHWDSSWYLTIVSHGYMHEAISKGHEVSQANWAFFPVLPYLVRFLSSGSRVHVLGIAFLLSNICLLIAMIFLYKYLAPNYSSQVTRITLLLISVSPVNVYFTAFYTESIFFALLMATIYYIKKHKWLTAGILGAFLTGTRNTGIFMVAIYVFEYFRSPDLRSSGEARRKYFIGLGIFPLGLLLYMLLLKNVMGDPLAFYHIQSAWGGPRGTYVTFILRTLREHRALQFVDVAVLLAAITSCIYFLWKNKITEFLVLLPVTVISFDSSRIHYRFYFAIYPIYLLIAILAEKRKLIVAVILLAEVLLLILSIKLWITGYGPT